MGNSSTESFGVNEFKNVLLKTQRVNVELIKENDRTPSWDGGIILYSQTNFKKNNIVGKIPIQIKTINSNSKTNKFTINKQDLLNYEKEGFVLYVYIKVKNDFTSSIYYLPLQLLDIKSCLSKYGNRQYKSFEFYIFPSEPDEVYKVLFDFLEERKKHKELIPNVTSIVDLVKLKGINTPVFFDIKTKPTSSIVDIAQAINDQKPYIRYHSNDVNLDFPVEHLTSNVEISLKTQRSIRVGETIYYQDTILSSDGSGLKVTNNEKNFVCEFHHNVATIKFKITGSLADRAKLTSFLNDMIGQNGFYIGEVPIPTSKNQFTAVAENIKNHYELYKKMTELFSYIHINKEPSFENITNDDIEKIFTLYETIIEKKTCEISKNETCFSTVKTMGLSILVICLVGKNEKRLLNWTSSSIEAVFENGDKCMLSPYYALGGQDKNENPLLYIDNIDYSAICGELFKNEYNKNCDLMVFNIIQNLLDFYGARKKHEALESAKSILEEIKLYSDDFSQILELENRIKAIDKNQKTYL